MVTPSPSRCNDYLSKNGGWTMVTNQISPLGTQDFSQYLTNIANSGADVIDQRELGPRCRAVDPAGKAVWVDSENEAGDTLSDPVPCQGNGAGTHRRRLSPPQTSGGRWRTNTRWPRCSSRLSEEIRIQARMGRQQRLHAIRHCGPDAVEKRAASTRRMSSSRTSRAKLPVDVGEVYFRAAGSPTGAAGGHRPRQAPGEMKNKEDYWEVIEVVPGEAADAEAGRVRLPLGDYT